MNDKKTALYLVTGFLGSGKTTLMRKLLSLTRNDKIGVILNEFGSVGVDGAILGHTGFTMMEINEGSIFCTCKSDAFIDALWELAGRDLDMILVETSGMSDPVSIPGIMAVVSTKTDRIQYHDCITIASATNIYKLLVTTLFVQGQVKQADILILNKTDLVESSDVEACIAAIRQYNFSCPIIEASFCNIPAPEQLLHISPGNHQDVQGPLQTKFSSAVSQFSLYFPRSVDKDGLIRLLDLFKHDIHRIKGFVSLSDGSTVLVDGVADDISLRASSTVTETSSIVFIYPNTKPVKHLLKQAYEKIFHEVPVIMS